MRGIERSSFGPRWKGRVNGGLGCQAMILGLGGSQLASLFRSLMSWKDAGYDLLSHLDTFCHHIVGKKENQYTIVRELSKLDLTLLADKSFSCKAMSGVLVFLGAGWCPGDDHPRLINSAGGEWDPHGFWPENNVRCLQRDVIGKLGDMLHNSEFG